MGSSARLKAVFPDKVRLGEALFYIPEVHVEVPAQIVFHIVMDLRGSLLHRLLRIKDPGKFFILHLDKFSGLFGRILIHRSYGRYGLCQIPYFLHRQRGFISGFGHPAPGPALEILSRADRFDSRQPFRTACIDTQDPSVGIGAS